MAHTQARPVLFNDALIDRLTMDMAQVHLASVQEHNRRREAEAAALRTEVVRVRKMASGESPDKPEAHHQSSDPYASGLYGAVDGYASPWHGLAALPSGIVDVRTVRDTLRAELAHQAQLDEDTAALQAEYDQLCTRVEINNATIARLRAQQEGLLAEVAALKRSMDGPALR